MTYRINNIELIEQPTYGGWMERQSLGISGEGRTIYSGIREYRLRWDVMSPSGMNQMQNFYNMSVTGTIVVRLPAYAHGQYTFYAYTGCVLSEPSYSRYFAEHYLDVEIVIGNIIA